MNLKHSCDVNGIKPEIVMACLVADAVYSVHGHSMTITSVVDSKHSAKSLHYIGHAVDLRTRDLEGEEAQIIAADIKSRLTDDYDVVVESDHIHIEYQPRYRK
jgi:hypothetical protein